MTNKEIYRQWAKEQSGLPIFMQPEWLDAVSAGKEWDVLLVSETKAVAAEGDADESKPVEERKEVLAAMPYLYRKRLGMHFILMPQLTQIGGIWLDEKKEWLASEIDEVCASMKGQLEGLNLSYYYQQYPINSPCPNRFEAMGFKVRERVTYRIQELQDLDKVIQNFSKNKKRQLQKALSLHAERGWTGEEFYRYLQSCFAARKKKTSYSREFMLVVEQKMRKLGQAEILTIRNADNEVYAAALLVWDKRRLYYLAPVFSPDKQESGAGALLVLEAIKIAREKSVIFDFEGSMIKGVANHYKQFGSKATLYYSVEKYYHWWFRPLMWVNKLKNIRF